jgi:hypothetical protein
MRFLVILLAFSLGGCSSITGVVPSFWDDNQSAKIIDARLTIERIDCQGNPQVQVAVLRDQLLWFELYSESKGSRQQDVIRVVHPIRETVEDMHKRYSEGHASKAYCEIKQRILRSQAQTAAEAVLGRF